MATVLQIIKGLVGKEDINWGDSSTTYNRETHTGGELAMSFVDAEIIPSTGLGGYIGDHLHKQDTDTGTSNTAFAINNAGNSVTLNAAGLSAGRVFTFPDTSDQALVGATDLASTANAKGASTVGIEDTAGYYTGTNVETALAEAGADVVSLQSTTHIFGLKEGFKMGYSSATAITIGGGMWAHTGTTNQHVFMNAQITFTTGSGGSNAASSALGASEVHYIYIDDSAVVTLGSANLTAAEFLNTTIEPAFSHTKNGWYNGNDRCIGAIRTDGSNFILDFDVVGDNYYRYAIPLVEFSVGAAGVTYAALDISSTVPKFCTRARINVENEIAGMGLYFDTANTATSPENMSLDVAARTYMTDISLNTSQVVYWYATAANPVAINLGGYFIDEL